MCIFAFRSTTFSDIFDSQGWHIQLALLFAALKSNRMTTCTLVPSNLLPKGIRLVCVWITSLAKLTQQARPHSSYNFLRLSIFWYTLTCLSGVQRRMLSTFQPTISCSAYWGVWKVLFYNIWHKEDVLSLHRPAPIWSTCISRTILRKVSVHLISTLYVCPISAIKGFSWFWVRFLSFLHTLR